MRQFFLSCENYVLSRNYPIQNLLAVFCNCFFGKSYRASAVYPIEIPYFSRASQVPCLAKTLCISSVTPAIEQDPKANPVKEGENLTLFCNASGSSLKISWEKNGSGINPSEDLRILLSRDNVQLTIVNVSRKDNGAYQCVASNEVGVATANAALVNVQFGPEISEPPIDNTKMEGQTVVFSCLVAGYPTPAVAWTKNGVKLNVTANLRLSVSSKDGNHTLNITDVQKSDAGQYRCVAKNSLQTSESSPSTLTVQLTPAIETHPQADLVKEGENLTLFCNATGSSLTISWTKNGSAINPDKDVWMRLSTDNEQLAITNVSRKDNGAYRCVASNNVGDATSNAAIVTVRFAPEISQSPRDTTEVEGQTAVFNCIVAGYPTPDAAWTKNEAELNVAADARLNISFNDGNHQLTISNVQQLDAGQYRCVANNSLDTATSSPATLTVHFTNIFYNESLSQLSITSASLQDSGNYTCNVTNNVTDTTDSTSIVIQVTPSIEQDPKASPVKERENLTLFCNASGSSLRISWEKNGSGINPSEDSRILLSRDNVQLTIVNVSRKDNGAYQCVASNEVESATSKAAIVNVQFGPEISEPPIDTTKIEGQTVVLSCLVAGYPTPAVAWTKNDVELNSIANLRLSVSSKNGNHTLKITDVQKSDAGQYRCVANNSLQTSKSSPSTLTVQFAPEVTIDGDQIHYVANSTDLQLTCRFHALPPASEVQWLNNGNVIASTLSVPSNGSRATISHHNESQAQLLITTVSLEDAGNYICNVTNVVGSSSNWTLITVQVTPAIETHPQADPVKEGENLTFFCNATGSSLTISWTKNRSSINPNEDVRIRLSTDKEHLTIRNVSRKDNGAYRCVASNKVGNATSNAAIVTVRFAPEISQSPRDTTEVEGQTAVFNCVVAGYPTPDVAWRKNGVELNVAEHARLRVSSNDGNHRLIISNVQQSDAGQYKCVANNSLDTVTSSSATLTVHFDPEVTIDGDKEKIVAKGDDIKVTCRHKALPPVTDVQWIKDGEVISTNSTKVINNSRLNILHFNESLIQLSISPAIVADSGNYTCNVTNMVNSSSDSTSIIVEVKPSIITQPNNVTAEEGVTVKLYCNATGSPILHISWTFDGSVITADENSRISLSNDSQELTITNVKRGDSGDYRCLVKNRVGNDTSGRSVINVLYRPEIITHPKNFTIEEGLPMTLFCNATGNPPPTLSWTKDGSPLNDTQAITFSGDNETLFIASINRSESGNYRCVARNGLGNDLSNPAKVDVQFAPEIVENPKDVTIVEGEDVVFSCTVDGNPSPRVTWTKNEEKLNTTTNLQLTASSLNNNNSLTIRDVHRSDSGQYRCVIINSVGNITSSPGDLNVQCNLAIFWLILSSSSFNKKKIPDYCDLRKSKAYFHGLIECYTYYIYQNFLIILRHLLFFPVPPEFISSPQNVTVIEEQNVNLTLNCTVNGNPTPDVKWTKDGIDISENQRIIVSDFKGNTSSLTITNIVRGDEGQYRCVANNSVNTTTSAPGKLTVNCEYYFSD
ncbi:unnamed protein product [Pocillopora meandrina]|uniref:Ig-like domain-containing protein n=1 Tax=Pocillopora meandrina TaxID=46732 RepID=A0AAU9Y2K8_9CNID|nr:unnamed protein product [Pocillopora meandrina]